MAANKIIYIIFLSLLTFGLKAQKNTDEKLLKDLVQNSFDDIFSTFDKNAVAKHYTKDFLLLEAGVVWNTDSVYAYIEKQKLKEIKPERINTFDFIKIKVSGNTAWVAYQNYAEIKLNGKSLAKLHWLESGSAIKTKEGWKLELLHSTRVENNPSKNLK